MCSIRGCQSYDTRNAVDDNSVTFEGNQLRNSEGSIFQQQCHSKYVYNMLHQCKDLLSIRGLSLEKITDAGINTLAANCFKLKELNLLLWKPT